MDDGGGYQCLVETCYVVCGEGFGCFLRGEGSVIVRRAKRAEKYLRHDELISGGLGR